MTQFNNKAYLFHQVSKINIFYFSRGKDNENNISSGFPKLVHYLETNDSVSDEFYWLILNGSVSSMQICPSSYYEAQPKYNIT